MILNKIGDDLLFFPGRCTMIEWFASIPPIPITTQLFFLLVLGLSLFLFGYLGYLLRKFWRGLDTLEMKDRFAIKNDFIKTAAQILGGAFFLFGLYFTWSNLVATQEKNKTDLYTKAIEQLGSNKPQVRLGGIYALERIARESEKDYWPIMEVLTAYVRENAPWPPKPGMSPTSLQVVKQKDPAKEKAEDAAPEPKIQPPADIQAILTVLVRRHHSWYKGENRPLDLRGTDLRGADLRQAPLAMAILKEANLAGADLEEANLGGAELNKANLKGVNLNESDLMVAQLPGAHLEGAKMQKANLKQANLERAHLEGAKLYAANLDGARLKDAHFEEANLQYAWLAGSNLGNAHLQKAELFRANLEGANLNRASLEGASLREANLSRAILLDTNLEETDIQYASLKHTVGVAKDQIVKATCWPLAFYDKYLAEEIGLPADHSDRLQRRDLSGYQLPGVDLRGALLITGDPKDQDYNLQGANLRGARLQGAHLGGNYERTDLSQAHLEKADFSPVTKMTGTKLAGAHLEGADLHDVKGLTNEQIASAIIDQETKLPKYLKNLEPEKPVSK
jgi:uncharacterized protein YjbI with pentapeptide repeats